MNGGRFLALPLLCVLFHVAAAGEVVVLSGTGALDGHDDLAERMMELRYGWPAPRGHARRHPCSRRVQEADLTSPDRRSGSRG